MKTGDSLFSIDIEILFVKFRQTNYMQSKSLLIAIAAFAVTATGVHAYGGYKILERAGLTNEQMSAIQEAQELRAAGDLTAARNLLIKAGIDEGALLSMHRVANKTNEAVREAVIAGDYKAFKEAVADSPLADIITSEKDFERFKEAHELRMSGNWDEAESLVSELGLEREMSGHHKVSKNHSFLEEFSDEQREAFQVAQQANDRATMHAILDEAGIAPLVHGRGVKYMME